MPLDIVSGTEVQTQSTGVKIDPSAFRRQAIAQGQLVSGAGQDVASLFSQVSNKLQDIQNTKHLAEANNAVIDFNEKQQEEVLKHPNPSEWSGIYKDNFKQFQDGLMANPSYGPDVRNQIRNMLEHSKTATDINIRTAANKRNVTDTGNAIEYAMTKAVNTYPEPVATEMYNGYLNKLKDSGIIDNKEYDLRLQQAPMIIGKGQLDQAVTVNPIEAWKKLQQKDKDGNPTWLPQFKGQDRIGINNEVRSKFYQKQEDNQRDLNLQFAKTTMTDQQKIAYVKTQAQDLMVTEQYADLKIRAILRADNKLQEQSYNSIKQLALRDITSSNPDRVESKKSLSALIAGIEDPAKQLELTNLITNLEKKAQKPEETLAKKNVEENRKDVLNTVKDIIRDSGPILPQVITETVAPTNGFWDAIAKFGTKDKVYNLGEFEGTYKEAKALYKKDPAAFEAQFGQGATPDIVRNNSLYYEQDLNKKINAWFDDPENAANANDLTKGRAMLNEIVKPYTMAITKNALGLIKKSEVKRQNLITDFQSQVLGLPSANAKTLDSAKKLPTFKNKQELLDAGLKTGDQFIDANTGATRTVQ